MDSIRSTSAAGSDSLYILFGVYHIPRRVLQFPGLGRQGQGCQPRFAPGQVEALHVPVRPKKGANDGKLLSRARSLYHWNADANQEY